ncbi:uncharacterized protein PHACADRAFT_199254 [Phanerochaete carnosa HHB-10118-sp]|uniref:Uncharacterized protein n=1 Tax=Phanerochaete carnosa (strain HHB-10118-sp) TaxID=650164 RepID=K5VY61_PHACS|nr:uncharacterized protein PHACADRAFT_199254 [Phanerochaete carnosa HHB-10118-sp]EKM51750.1 hypothetical protein PHACADRAFT_199254 [Phanerochaete carnosa HHB-10118-sp]
MVVAKREKDHWAKILRNAVAWRKKLQNRTILTGGYMKPTILHGPLPRMKPQPLHVTGMIVYRKKARERRLMRYLAYNEQMRDIKREAQIETMLARSHKQMLPFFFAGAQDEWMKPIREHQALMELSYAREYQRANASFPPKMLKQVKNARRMKVENKTRERQRELAGQVINRTIRRARRGPPAHVLTFMTPRRRYYDRVARSSVTEVGYVGWVKKKLGFKLKNPDPFAVENGKEADQPKLDAEEEEIRKENLRRRVEAWKRRNVVSVPEKGAKEKGEEQNVSKYPNC